MTSQLHELSVSELSAELAARRASPVDVVECPSRPHRRA